MVAVSAARFCIVSLFIAMAPAEHSGQPQETSLFNGKDLTGWRTFIDPKAKIDGKNLFTVKDGVIVCAGKPNGFISTTQEYSDYILKLEWRWADLDSKGKRYSSAFVHVTGKDQIWPKGVDVTLGDKGAGQFWLLHGHMLEIESKRRDPKNTRHYFAMHNDAEKPLGEWNELEVVCKGNSIDVKINGKLVNQGVKSDPAKGRIILIAEAGEIHFRNLKVLSEATKPAGAK